MSECLSRFLEFQGLPGPPGKLGPKGERADGPVSFFYHFSFPLQNDVLSKKMY